MDERADRRRLLFRDRSDYDDDDDSSKSVEIISDSAAARVLVFMFANWVIRRRYPIIA